MIGTSTEMLLYFSYQDSTKDILKMTHKRVKSLRYSLSRRLVCEETMCDYLTKLGCRCIRPRVTLPCIVKDKNGRLFDEYTFVKLFFTHELADKYGVDYNNTMNIAKNNRSINRPLFRHLLKSKRAWIILDKMTIDSVWSYEPIELTITSDKVIQINGMLARSLPTQGHPCDDLTFQRKSPELHHPQDMSVQEQLALPSCDTACTDS